MPYVFSRYNNEQASPTIKYDGNTKYCDQRQKVPSVILPKCNLETFMVIRTNTRLH